MELRLGQHVFDVSTQALVVAPTASQSPLAVAQAHAANGADGIFVTGLGNELVAAVGQYAAALQIPIIVQAQTGELARQCLRAGASVIDGGVLADPELLPVIVDADGSVLIARAEWARLEPGTPQTEQDNIAGLSVTIERARWAEAAGLTKSRIIVEAPADQVAEAAAYGYPVAIATSDGDETAQGVQVAAAMNGARLMRSNTVRATKRTVSTVNELLQRRGTAAPHAVEFAGSN